MENSNVINTVLLFLTSSQAAVFSNPTCSFSSLFVTFVRLAQNAVMQTGEKTKRSSCCWSTAG